MGHDHDHPVPFLFSALNAEHCCIHAPSIIEADPDRLQQFFENLFRNAIDHAGESVEVRVGALSEKAGFYVDDDGPGIPEDERDEVFTFGTQPRRKERDLA